MAQERSGVLAHFHRHGHVDPREVEALMDEAGFHLLDQGAVGVSSRQFFLARTACKP